MPGLGLSKDENAMQMIGHQNKFIEFYLCVMLRNIVPAFHDDIPKRRDMDNIIDDPAEGRASSRSADSHKIRGRSRVVVVGQPHAFAQQHTR